MVYRYFIKLSFDGSAYSGWQVQQNASNTVQQKVNEALSRVLGEKIETLGCCRTDAGVHAKELYAQFDSAKGNLSALSGNWAHKLNSLLPKDISVDAFFQVKSDANARFDATSRAYRYLIHSRKDPFLINRSYYYYSELDMALMNKACRIMQKHKDFTAFSKVNTQVKTNICKIKKASWKKTSAGYEFSICADRFLRGMVRMIVGTMIEVGKHKLTLKEFREILESHDCRNAGVSVPACGLYLEKVEYPNSLFLKQQKA